MAERKFIRTDRLTVGMRIDQAVVDRMDRVLVHRGSILDEFVIAGLKKLGLPGVYIGDGIDEVVKNDDPMAAIEASITPVVKNKIYKLR